MIRSSLPALASICFATGILAADEVRVGAVVEKSDRVSIEKIDHTSWDELLQQFCDQRGYVDYQRWKDSTADKQKLDQYLAQLSRADTALPASKASKLAFWINAYNAVTIEGILREYPTTSIRNHTARFIGYNIWDDLLLRVGGEEYSLNQMEHEVLRKMGEPRIHFAIVCASIGCPPLLNRAYTAEKLDEQLTSNAKRFFADSTKFDVAEGQELKLSAILNWFAEDFGADQAVQLKAIAPFLPTAEARALATSGKASVSYLDYDWGLNDQAARESTR